MASDDFLKLTSMIYGENWRPIEYNWKWNKQTGYFAKVVLKRDAEAVELSSSAIDFVMFVADVQRVADSKGQVKLAKIQNANRYWNDMMNHFEDQQGEKLKAAADSVAKGTFQFDFDPFSGVRKILQGKKIPVSEPDVRGVKEHYFETFAFIALTGLQSLKTRERTEKTNAKFASYYSAIEKILRDGFVRPGKKMEPTADYRNYLDLVALDIYELGRHITEQSRYTDFLVNLLTEKGTVDVENGVRAIVDVYWRMCELCYPMLNVLRIAIELSEGKAPSKEKPTFEDLAAFLGANSQTEQLVECVQPLLRNCEAHCTTSVVMENREPTVVTYETRTAVASEISRIPFAEVDHMTKCLKFSLVPALYVALTLFEYAFQILTLRSNEFKLLLVTMGQY
jgi:hypothetical protein